MPDLLIELFSEEIPARMQARAAADLQKLVQEALFSAGFMPDGAKGFATPRRLALVVTGLPGVQPDRREERKGPRVGAPEKAVEGFLKSTGLSSIDQCEKRSDKKGEYYVHVIEEKGRPTSEVIAAFMPEIISKFPWPKSMRWGDGDLRWVRPLHSILCTFEDEVAPFEVGGIQSGDRTFGHRFLASDETQVRNFEAYDLALSRAKVILDGDRRMEQILADARSLCAAQGFELVDDRGLLAEVAGLAEWPITLMGSFDEKFLALPDEVLTASMKGHQKYFSVRDPNTRKLVNKFVFVSNIEAPDGGAAMRTGYERVLTARLSDAWFLYQEDLKKPLSVHVEKLSQVTYFKGLGSVGDKVARIIPLAQKLSTGAAADEALVTKAAQLAKADLVTSMVYEFPELQGLMGRYYALAQGEPPVIADAIRDHYKPAGSGDEVPAEPVAVSVALAEKLDTLFSFWLIDEKPTGSKDPFALRRAALGVIQIILQSSLRLQLSQVFDPLIYSGIADKADRKAVMLDLIGFVHDRLKVYLKEQSFEHDVVDAVRVRADGHLEDDLVLIVRKLEALSGFLGSEDGVNLLAAYKRAGNILKAEQKKQDAEIFADVDDSLVSEVAEIELLKAIRKAREDFAPALAEERFADAVIALAALRVPLDKFFETVTVNADDPDIRRNRLALLKSIITTCDEVADFSKVKGK